MKKLIFVITTILMFSMIFEVETRADDFIDIEVRYSFDPDGEPLKKGSLGVEIKRGEIVPRAIPENSQLLNSRLFPYDPVDNHRFRGYTTVKPTEEDILTNNFTIDNDATIGLNADTILYAIYERTHSEIEWYDFEGNLLKQEIVPYNTAGDKPVDSVYERYGFDFVGFNVSTRDYVYAKTDLQIRPVYEPRTFTITFLDIEGKELSKRDYLFGEKIEYVDPPMVNGYVFSKWSSNPELVRANTTIRPVYKEIDLDNINVEREKIVDASYFTNNRSNDKFDEVVENQALANLKFGNSSVIFELSGSAPFTITDYYVNLLGNLDVDFKIKFDNLETLDFNFSDFDDEINFVNRNVSGPNTVIYQDEFNYTKESEYYSFSLYDGEKEVKAEFYPDVEIEDDFYVLVYDINSSEVVDVYKPNEDFISTNEDESALLVTRIKIIVEEETSFIDNVVNYIKNASDGQIIIFSLSTLVIILGIGIIIKRKK